MKNIIYTDGFPTLPLYTYTISRVRFLIEDETMFLDLISFSEDITDINEENKLITTSRVVEADSRERMLSTLSKEAIQIFRKERGFKKVYQVDKECFYNLLTEYKDNLIAVEKSVIEKAMRKV